MGSAGTHLVAAHWIVRYRHVIISDAGMAVSPLVAPGERGYWRVPYPDSQPCRPAGGGAFFWNFSNTRKFGGRRLPDVRAYLSPVASQLSPAARKPRGFLRVMHRSAGRLRLLEQGDRTTDRPFAGAKLFQAQIPARRQLAAQRLGELPGVVLEAGGTAVGRYVGRVCHVELPLMFQGTFGHALIVIPQASRPQAWHRVSRGTA